LLSRENNNGILKTIKIGESIMTAKAEQILEYLHKRFPDMFFAWEDIIWFLGDNTVCTLFVSFRATPDEKESMKYGEGIENISLESIADRDIPHLISRLNLRKEK
jgi:hypothetical protein